MNGSSPKKPKPSNGSNVENIGGSTPGTLSPPSVFGTPSLPNGKAVAPLFGNPASGANTPSFGGTNGATSMLQPPSNLSNVPSPQLGRSLSSASGGGPGGRRKRMGAAPPMLKGRRGSGKSSVRRASSLGSAGSATVSGDESMNVTTPKPAPEIPTTLFGATISSPSSMDMGDADDVAVPTIPQPPVRSVPLSVCLTSSCGGIHSALRTVTSHALECAIAYAKHSHLDDKISIQHMAAGRSPWMKSEIVSPTSSSRNSIAGTIAKVATMGVAQVQDDLLATKAVEELRRRGFDRLYERSCTVYLTSSPDYNAGSTQDVLPGTRDAKNTMRASTGTSLGGKQSDEWYNDPSASGRFVLKYATSSRSDKKHPPVLYQYAAQFRSKANLFRPQRRSSSRNLNNNSSSSRPNPEDEMLELTAMGMSPPDAAKEVGGDVGDPPSNGRDGVDWSALQRAAASGLCNPDGTFTLEVHSGMTGNNYRFHSKAMDDKAHGDGDDGTRDARSNAMDTISSGNPGREGRKSLGITLVGKTVLSPLLEEPSDSPLSNSIPHSHQQSVMSARAWNPFQPPVPGRGITTVRLTIDSSSLAVSALDDEANDVKSEHPKCKSCGSAFDMSAFGEHHEYLMNQFRVLDPASAIEKPVAGTAQDDKTIAHGTLCSHQLLLHPSEIGRVYVNGQFVTEWGRDVTAASNLPALFGVDLMDVPLIHETGRAGAGVRIGDYDYFLKQYGQLLQEVLIDAAQEHKEIAGTLLLRLVHGLGLDEDYPEVISMRKDEKVLMAINGYDINDDYRRGPRMRRHRLRVDRGNYGNVDARCLESEVMSNTLYDPVGIAAKALGTKFYGEYGVNAYPCLLGDNDYVKAKLGQHRVPVVVPQRAIDVLRRGGFFALRRAEKELWFDPAEEGVIDKAELLRDDYARSVIGQAISLVCLTGGDAAGLLTTDNLFFLSGKWLADGQEELSVFTHKTVCRYNRENGKFYINEDIISAPLPRSEEEEEENLRRSFRSIRGLRNVVLDDHMEDEMDETVSINKRAYLLGLCIAQEHPDPTFLIRFVLQNESFTPTL